MNLNEGYSRKVSCALYLISSFLLSLIGETLCYWWNHIYRLSFEYLLWNLLYFLWRILLVNHVEEVVWIVWKKACESSGGRFHMDSSSEWSRCLNLNLSRTWTWYFERFPCPCDMLWFWTLAFLYLFWFEAVFELVDDNIRGVDTVWKEYEVVFNWFSNSNSCFKNRRDVLSSFILAMGYVNCVLTEVWTALITLTYDFWSFVLFLVFYFS